jgi:FkbM family methyltransferase
MAYHNPAKPIFCFEPLASNVRMIALNCPRATVAQVGVGKERTSVRLRVDPHGIMATSVATKWPTQEEEFQVLPLDELVREHNIEKIAFMKVDTEGMELDILDGGQATLARTQECALETHGREKHEGVLDRLRAAGFQITRDEFDGNTGLVFAAR